MKAKNWWRTFNKDIKRLGYKRLEADQSVRSRERDEERMVTSTYTDNISGISSSKVEAEKVHQKLGEKYEIKDLGDAKFVLGIQIICN